MSGGSSSQSVTATANGSSATRPDLLQNEQLNSELKNLMGILTGKGGSINLEQLLSGSHSSRPQLKPSTPTHVPPTVIPSPSHSTTPNYPASLATRKRARTFDFDADSAKRRRGAPSYSSRQSGEKQHNKGLRHFSQRVCEKVREKGTTTYNEVADELVKELTETEKKSATSEPIDHKNIRRRVYDALNVLMAMNIISKEKKEIKWLGLPTNSAQECQHIEAELEQAEERIRAKQSEVEDLLIQILSFKNLMKRNRERVANLGTPSHNSAISLPFLVVNTSKKTTIDCSISSDKSEYVFNFDNAFELHNDIDVLKKMGLDCGLHSGQCSADDLRLAKSMLPKGFEATVDEIAQGKKVMAANACPGTPSSSASNPQLTSTPSNPPPVPATASSPSTLSPLLHSATHPQASPLAIAAALNQLKAAVAASPIVTSNTLGHTAGSSPLVNLSSPQAVTALVNEALKGAKTAQLVSTLQAASSHSSQAGPQTTAMSPLLKSVGAASPIGAGVVFPVPNGSPRVAKSPGPKIVTVSKLPAAMTTQNDQLSSLLQSLQQHSSPLLKPPTTASANGHTPDTHTSIGSSSNGVV